MADVNELDKDPRKSAWLLFLCAALAGFLALRGFLDLESHGGVNVLALIFEAILPSVLAVGALWYGIVYWRKSNRAV